MTVWPKACVSLSASARASTSVVPPAGNGTTSVTGLLGQASAWARPALKARASVQPISVRRRGPCVRARIESVMRVSFDALAASPAGRSELAAHRLRHVGRRGPAAEVARVQLRGGGHGLDGLHE